MSENQKVSPKGNPNLRVFILDDESKSLDTCLGITEERSNELIEIVREAHKNSDTHTDSFVEISKYAKHANELVYMIFHYGANVGSLRVASEIGSGGLDELLQHLKRKLNPGNSEEDNA